MIQLHDRIESIAYWQARLERLIRTRVGPSFIVLKALGMIQKHCKNIKCQIENKECTIDV